MKKVFLKLSAVIASLALTVTAMNVNTTCIYLIHQPELPKAAEKLRRF